MIRLATLKDIPDLEKLLTLSVRGLSKEYYTSNQIESALKYIFGIDTQVAIYPLYTDTNADDLSEIFNISDRCIISTTVFGS